LEKFGEKYLNFLALRCEESLARGLLFHFLQELQEVGMEANAETSPKMISIKQHVLRAATCEECGAKMYPPALLEPHLTRHRRRQEWFSTELRKLQYTFSHMRDIA
jgi:uncharacterized OB-fold protein